MLEAKPKRPGLAVSKRGKERVVGSLSRERQGFVCRAGQQSAGHGTSTVQAAAGSHGTGRLQLLLQSFPACPARALRLCFPVGSLHAPLGADPEVPGEPNGQRRREGSTTQPCGCVGSGEDGVPAFPGRLRPAQGLPSPPAPPAASVLPAGPVAASPLPPSHPPRRRSLAVITAALH